MYGSAQGAQRAPRKRQLQQPAGDGYRLYYKDGNRYVWANGRDAAGERWFESTHQVSERLAHRVAAQLASRYAVSRVQERVQKAPLARALTALVEHKAKKGRAGKTLKATTYHCGHLVAFFGETRALESIGIKDTTQYMEHRLAGTPEELAGSKHTIEKELLTLEQAWKRLAKLGQLPPCPKLIPDELEGAYVPRERALTREEYGKLHKALGPQKAGTNGGYRHHGEDRRDYLAAYCFTGARREELFKYVRSRDLGKGEGGTPQVILRGTKTKKATRPVPLVRDVLPVFQRRETFPEWHSIVRDLKRGCERAGIPHVTPNDLRRTFCTWLLDANVPERDAADLMGHEDSTMVKRVYGQRTTYRTAEAAKKMEGLGISAFLPGGNRRGNRKGGSKGSKGGPGGKRSPAKKPAKRGKKGAPSRI